MRILCVRIGARFDQFSKNLEESIFGGFAEIESCHVVQDGAFIDCHCFGVCSMLQ